MLDLNRVPALRMHQPPQGYVAPGADPVAQAQAVAGLAAMVGEFEKPKFFNYKASICAHSRSEKTGCTQCIDVCSTAAIAADGDHVKVEPHLCMGCGACATVCPSGAMTYAYPSVPHLGQQIRTLLATYAKAGGRDACLLLHAEDGRAAIARLARRGRGLPARVIPLEVHHVAAVGIDVWLAALALGASQVAVLATGAEAPQYREALDAADGASPTASRRGWVTRASTSASSMPPMPPRCDAALWSWPAALPVRVAATFALTADKRTTAAFAIEHLALHAPVPQREIALPAGAPFGTIAVNRDTCTMCLACVGSCPVGAILDAQEKPQLRFIEAKCVQCGLCATTCPEHAIALTPRLNLAPEAKAPRVLNEAAVFQCIACGKPMGTAKMVGSDARAARRPFDVRRAGRARSAADVRRLPRHRHDEEARAASMSATADRGAMETVAVPCIGRSRRKTRRARISTRCLRGSTPTPPDAALLAAIARAAPLGDDADDDPADDAPPTLAGSVERVACRQRGDGSGRCSRGVQRPFHRRGQERGQPARVALADRLHDGKAAGRGSRDAGADWGSPGAPAFRCSRIISPRCAKRCAS